MRALRPFVVAASAVTALAMLAPLAGAQGPTRPPAPMPLTPAQFPPFAEATLPNGLRLLVVPSTKQPVLSVTSPCRPGVCTTRRVVPGSRS